MARSSRALDFLVFAILIVLWTPISAASSSEVHDNVCDSSEAHTRAGHRTASTVILWTPSSEVRDNACDSSEAHTRGGHRKASTDGIEAGRHVHDDDIRTPQMEAHRHPLRGISPPDHQLYGGDGQVSSYLYATHQDERFNHSKFLRLTRPLLSFIASLVLLRLIRQVLGVNRKLMPAVAYSKTYTTTADFSAANSIVNVSVNNPGDQVQLNDDVDEFGFIWVPKTGTGTVVKIDTNNGTILGEYMTNPTHHGLGRSSRTSVDKDGSVWVADFVVGSVVHIGLVENGQCHDRNGNGMIDTSTGLGVILSWSVDEADQGNPNLALHATDECIIHYLIVNSESPDHVSVNDDNDVWVGGWGLGAFDLIKGGGPAVSGAGTIIKSYPGVGNGGDGGLISGTVLWSSRVYVLLRWDTTLPLTGLNGDPSGDDIGPPTENRTWAGDWNGPYYSSNLCLDMQGNVWNTRFTGSVRKYAADGKFLGVYDTHDLHSITGCAVDARNGVGTNDVWLASWEIDPGYRSIVSHLKNDGTWVGKINITGQEGASAVSVDAKGKIWVTNQMSDTVSRIDPKLADGLGAVDLTVYLGKDADPWGYSDMTGSILRSPPPPTTGSWTAVIDSTELNYSWAKSIISWNSLVPNGTKLTVAVSSSDDGVGFKAETIVADGTVLSTIPVGRYLKIQVLFQREAPSTKTPVLYDLQVVEPCRSDG